MLHLIYGIKYLANRVNGEETVQLLWFLFLLGVVDKQGCPGEPGKSFRADRGWRSSHQTQVLPPRKNEN